MPDDDKDVASLWAEAQSFNELCQLRAQLIEGENFLEAESTPLIPYLAALNRAGLLTTCSQPGEDRGHSKQRAFVSGLASKEIAERIERLSLCSDLYIMTTPPGHHPNGCRMPVTISAIFSATHKTHYARGFSAPSSVFLAVSSPTS